MAVCFHGVRDECRLIFADIEDARTRSTRPPGRRALQVALFVVGIAVLIAIPVLFEGGTSSRGTRPIGSDQTQAVTVSQKIERIAQQEGASMGDPVITSDHWVLTKAASAEAALGSGIASRGSAYLIEITGSFNVYPNRLPGSNSCEPRPPVAFAYFVADQMIHTTGILEIRASPIDLTRFGQVHSGKFPGTPSARRYPRLHL